MPIKFIAYQAKNPFSGNEKTLVKNELDVFATKLEKAMVKYPPAPARSKYRRTGTLKRSWEKDGPKQVGSALVAEIYSSGNMAPYNKRVQGDEQTRVFKRIGWKVVDDVAKPLWATAVKNITKILEQK